MEAIALVYAHPYPGRSIACRALLEAASTVEALEAHSLYDLYPDFDIDVEAERAALERAGLVVFLHPLFWYSVPGMLKHYFDVVLTKGWAYGEGGGALAGKSCLWAVSTGGDEHAFSPAGRHHRPFADFIAPVEQTARYCGMRWLEPHLVLAGHQLPPEELAATASAFRERMLRWRAEAG